MAVKTWLAGIVVVLSCAVTTEAPAQYVRVYNAADSTEAQHRVFRGYLETKLRALGFVVMEPVEETDSFAGWELTFQLLDLNDSDLYDVAIAVAGRVDSVRTPPVVILMYHYYELEHAARDAAEHLYAEIAAAREKSLGTERGSTKGPNLGQREGS